VAARKRGWRMKTGGGHGLRMGQGEKEITEEQEEEEEIVILE
jgi:hypothetical protein